jgi:hypothetical protein
MICTTIHRGGLILVSNSPPPMVALTALKVDKRFHWSYLLLSSHRPVFRSTNTGSVGPSMTIVEIDR